MNSVKDGHPGYVAADYLNAISAETTITAAELCTAGLWRRVDGGYEVVQRELVDMVVEQRRRHAEARRLCQETGGHKADEESPEICRKCFAPID